VYESIYTIYAADFIETRNAWQSLAYSPLGAVVASPSEDFENYVKKNTYLLIT